MATLTPTTSYVGTNGNDYMPLDGATTPIIVDGAAGDDFIETNDQYDLIYGNTGRDLILAAGGSDTIYGDSYADPLQPGSADHILGDGAGFGRYLFPGPRPGFRRSRMTSSMARGTTTPSTAASATIRCGAGMGPIRSMAVRATT